MARFAIVCRAAPGLADFSIGDGTLGAGAQGRCKRWPQASSLRWRRRPSLDRRSAPRTGDVLERDVAAFGIGQRERDDPGRKVRVTVDQQSPVGRRWVRAVCEKARQKS